MKIKGHKMLKKTLLVLSLITTIISNIGAQCTEDCVWPGDFNANGIANNVDILAYGFAFGQSGPARSNASTTWQAESAEDWGTTLPLLGADYKHVDGNGDGFIDQADQFVIAVNYEQTNDNFAGLLGNDILGDDLFLVPDNNATSPGGSLFFDVHLGTADNPINDLYGIAFRLNMDTEYVEDVLFDFSETWIGSDDDYFGFGKFNESIDHAGTAVTRLDGNTVSGFGKIARIEIVITDVIIGLQQDTTASIPFPVTLEKVLGIDNQEGDLMITANGTDFKLQHSSQLTPTSNLNTNLALNQTHVSPNPATNKLTVSSASNIERLVLYNQIGQIIFDKDFSNSQQKEQSISLTGLHTPSGIYFLQIISEKQKNTCKLRIEN